MAHPLINLIKSPSVDVLAAYNCIEFVFEITDNITVIGNESFLDIQIDNPLVLGDTFNVFGQQFLITNDANTNGHNVALGVTATEQRDFIYNTLLTNYEISKQFDFIKSGVEHILFTAKKKGIDYDTNFSTTNTNVQLITETDGVDTEVRDTYKIIGCLQVKVNGEWKVFDEEVRDVTLKINDVGNLISEVCFKLHGILRNYFTNQKPDLNNFNSSINDGAVFEFKFGIVDFKSTTGQAGVSGFFDNDTETYCIFNGMYKKTDAEKKLTPYYEKQLDGHILSLNQTPLTNYYCCGNNAYMTIFVRDKDSLGWGVQLIGDVFFDGGGIESNYNYGGLSGIGSAVIVIPIGPRQLAICENFLGLGEVIKYTYQAIVFSGSAGGNLFVDGDNGTFENNITGITSLLGVLKAQTNDGYIGNGLELSEFFNATLNPFFAEILRGDTTILLELGNTYFIDAWIKLEGVPCECLANLFTDGEFGTFDGLNPLDVISVIAGATFSIIAGFENNSLNISDLDSSFLAHLFYVTAGGTPIVVLPNKTYELTAWVKVTGVDCIECIVFNLFVDGDNGTFENGATWSSGIVQLLGITIGQDSGFGSTDGLLMETLNLATIPSGSQLFRGDTNIDFSAGTTYIVTMQVLISNFNCSLIGNLFVDGDNGTFENGATWSSGIVQLLGITIGQDSGFGSTDGLLMETLNLATIPSGSQLFRGDTNIDFSAGTTYIVTMQVLISNFNCSLIGNLFVDGDNGTFENDILGMSSPQAELIVTHIHSFPSKILLLESNLPMVLGSNSVILLGDTAIAFLVGETYELSCWIDLEGDAAATACADPTGIEFKVGIADVFSIGDITIVSDIMVVYNSSTCGPTWQQMKFTFTVNNAITKRVGVQIASGSSFFEPALQECYFDNMIVKKISGTPQVINFNAGLTAPIGANGTETIDTELVLDSSCSLLDTWVQIQTTLVVTNNFTGKVGLITTGNSPLLEYSGVLIRVDDVVVTAPALPQVINFNAGLTAPIGANGTETIDTELVLDSSCSLLDTWVQIQTTLVVTNNFTGKVGLITTGNSPLLEYSGVLIRVDDVVILTQFTDTTLRMNASFLPSGTTVVFDNEIILGSDCSQLDEWVKLKTTFSTPAFGIGNIQAGLQALGNVNCLKQADVEIMIDNIELTVDDFDGIEFEITTTDGATPLVVATIDSCDDIGEWHRLSSSYTPSIDVNEKVVIAAKNFVQCLNEATAKVLIDSVSIRCYSLDAANTTPEQTAIIVGECDTCIDCCCNEEFFYRNELGVFDVLHLECIKSGLTTVSKTNVEVCKDCDDDISTEGAKTTSVISKDKFVINARIEKDRREQFKIFLASIEIFHTVDNKYYPITILNSDLELFQKTKNFVDIDLEFEYKFENPTLIS